MISVLLVEDERATVELLREAIKDSEQDIELEVFSNGEEALKHLSMKNLKGEALPNLLLLDLNLPGRSGLDVLKEVKQSKSLRMLPVIIMTNSRSPDDVVKAYAAHCNAYIRKPMGFDDIIEIIEGTGKFWFEIAVLPDSTEVPPQMASFWPKK